MSKMEKFGLSQIENAWIKEKSEEDLAELPEDFYEKVANHATKIRREIRDSQDLRKEILKKELKHVLNSVQEIYLLRILKITGALFQGGEEKLLEKEKRTFENVKNELDELQDELIEPILKSEIELKKPTNPSNTMIVTLSEISEKIIAADLKYYGPFKKGEIVNLPNKSAGLLAEQGLARKVKVNELQKS